ncbi:zinc-ribbon domain-containing protein [Schleiferilactobacillus shenzhenensis]|uniref:zinc-ribbon domain-containing protein n=1 Tax=Schleiferilactobacillus shenzhenensis TaxID=1231337 RepID=UPI0009E04F7C|nr:zinc-ribbon domain-containing protein [Schleiferilactobacillus shenzhenensis]
MKICPHCGAENAATAKFCTRCGTSLVDVPVTTAQADQSTAPAASTVASQPDSSATNSAAPGQTPPAAPGQATPPPTASVPPAYGPTPDQGNVPPAYVAPAQPAGPNRLDQAKTYGANYFNNLLQSWQHPMAWAAHQQDEHPYYGIISLVLLALLNTLAFWGVMRHIVQLLLSWAVKYASNLGGVIGGASVASNLPSASEIASVQAQVDQAVSLYVSNAYIQFFLYTIAIFALNIVVGYLAKRYLMGDETQSFFSYVNQFSYYLNSALIVAAIMAVLALLGIVQSYVVLIGLIMIAGAIFNVAFFMATTQGVQKRLDRVYTMVIVQVAVNVLVMLFVTSRITSIVTTIIDQMQHSGLFR